MALQSSVLFSIVKAPPAICNRLWLTQSVSTQCYFEGLVIQPMNRGGVIFTVSPASASVSDLHRASICSQQISTPTPGLLWFGESAQNILVIWGAPLIIELMWFLQWGEVGKEDWSYSQLCFTHRHLSTKIDSFWTQAHKVFLWALFHWDSKPVGFSGTERSQDSSPSRFLLPFSLPLPPLPTSHPSSSKLFLVSMEIVQIGIWWVCLILPDRIHPKG